MQSKYSLTKSTYDGTQLRHLFAYLDHDILGDSIISWQGACDIPTDNIIDGEDLKSKSIIKSDNMLHFIIEKFNSNLYFGVALQRLFVSLIQEDLHKHNIFLTRKGDDLYFTATNNIEKKFNISVATQNAVSSVIHLAVNITTKGTPVPTSSLKDFQLDKNIQQLSERWMHLLIQEVNSIEKATQKVFLL